MKNILLTTVLAICSFSLVAQQNDQVSQESEFKCSHAHLPSITGRTAYYQYPAMDKYDMKYLKLDINAEPGSRFMSGTATWKAIAKQAMDSFVIEFRSTMILDSVYINGTKRAFTRGSDHIFIPLSPVVSAGTTLNLVFYYNGTTSSAGVFAGTNSSGLTYTATLSESYQAREWFPAKQILTDKIDSADIWVTTTAGNKVGSNGLLQAVVPVAGGKEQHRWHTRYPMNYYLPSISVGNYMEYLNYAKPAAMAPDSILVQHYLADNPTYFNSVKTFLDNTTQFIEAFSDLFGLYPFKDEKYGHAQAGIGGGMEHQTMSTMNGFSNSLVSHELGHQWFGDNVTCANWNDIWLNEGFARYCEYLAMEYRPSLYGSTAAAQMLSWHNDILMSVSGSVRVPDADVYNEGRIFSGRFSYNKGAAIIHTLRFLMQDDNLFFQTLKNYQNQFRDSTATAADFKQVAETTSGKNFTDFFNQWYTGEGYPTFNITYLMQGSDSIILIVNQVASAPAITPFFKGLYEMKITSAQGDTTVLIDQTVNDQIFKFPYHKTPNGIVVDPNNWVLNKVGTITFGGTVPVTITSFTGSDEGCGFKLDWSAENRLSTIRYEIEYSTDGASFSKVGEVNGSYNVSDYTFSYVPASATVAYFRLKIIDRYGIDTYSNVVSLTGNCNKSFDVTVTPNPFHQSLSMEINLPESGKTGLRILNAAGQTVYRENRQLNAGRQFLNLPQTAKLAPGAYTLQVVNASGVIISKKIIKY